MTSAPVFCKAVGDGSVINFVANGLKEDVREYIPSLELGIFKDKLIGGVLINDIRPERDCNLSIYTESPQWAARQVIKYVFTVVFLTIGAKRCTVYVSESNKKSHEMCLRLGFKDEGFLREYRENGENCYVMGMLKQECKWI
jgi:RimJ/RimL family protein N-acetyltransferase